VIERAEGRGGHEGTATVGGPVTITAQPIPTVADVLFAGLDPARDPTPLLEALRANGISAAAAPSLGILTPSATDVVDTEIVGQVVRLSAVSVGDVLLAGWRAYQGLTDATRRSRESPGTAILVDLARHRIASTYQPHVDVRLNGVTVWTLAVRLAVEFTVEAAVASVRDGRVASIRCGDCELAATLAVNDKEITRRSTRLETGLEIALGTRPGA
jgi:hypothetical protein